MQGDGAGSERDGLVLERFLPYRLSVLSNRISQAIARAYGERHDLSVTEWRTLAVLGRFPGLSASEIVERTAMDKVAVSRAVATLVRQKRIRKTRDKADKRRAVLRLTPVGQSVYAAVAAEALACEDALLGALGPEERAALDRVLARLAEDGLPRLDRTLAGRRGAAESS
ncbi:MAG: MarR family winged helix-turn-helix transcriptional regulator [Xanthomonadales bacterium]|jgi:DNA-binding MarR family transcriptional regulator|nr:MarR family winged helix-turn-helix transcriptional regulator [Xanthomonadales bacterium]